MMTAAAPAPPAAPVTTNQTYRVVVRSVDPKTGFSQTRAVSVLASTPEAAEQAAATQVQANKWKGDWVPIEVSPTTGPAIPYTKGGEEGTATGPAPAGVLGSTPIPGSIPERPAPGERGVSGQLLGLRPRPPVQYHISRPRPPVGAEWLNLGLWWNQVFYRQERPGWSSPIPPMPKSRSVEL
jgi:hypothetical protein